ncbi:MAG TPA: signal peptidase I [Dehalococcoidia bacterium]|nr:signal peptidase I [Dehalococcoidia bacterium]
MPDFDDNGGLGGGGRGEREPRPFDPLFDHWADEEPTAATPAPHDDLFALDPVASERAEEEYDWYRPYTPTAVDYPRRAHPLYEQRLTELQRRLRAETITIPAPQRRWAVTARELAETLVLAVLIFLAVRASFQNFRVEGASMQPSLEDGEYLIVNKLSYAELDVGFLDFLPFVGSDDDEGSDYLWGKPDRGDVVVFVSPTSTDRDFIKRIIGLPGDTITIDDSNGEVTVNGVLLDEPYIQGVTRCNGSSCQHHLPAAGSAESFERCGSSECYFVMGDNRLNSSDSRLGWLVPKENIIGKALITYWHQGGPRLDLAPNHSVGSAEEAD